MAQIMNGAKKELATYLEFFELLLMDELKNPTRIFTIVAINNRERITSIVIIEEKMAAFNNVTCGAKF